MKKITLVSIISFLFLVVSSAVTLLLKILPLDNAVTLLIIGVGLLLVSGGLAIFAKKKICFNVICMAISSVALGFCIRAWYLFRGFDNPIWVMLLVSLACVVYLWVFYAITKIPFVKRYFKVCFWVILLLSIVAYVLLVVFTTTTYVSTFGYYMIIEIAFIFALCSKADDIPSTIRQITLSTYSILVVAAIIAIAMISEGDLDLPIDGVDLAAEVFDVDVRNANKRQEAYAESIEQAFEHLDRFSNKNKK